MISLECYGHVFTVEGPPECAALLGDHGFSVRPSVAEDQALVAFRLDPQGDYYDLYHGPARSSRQQPLAVLCEIIASRVHSRVSFECSNLTFLRAEVVKWQEKALVLAGSTLTGKSRMAQALMAEGGKVWSRHFAVVDDEGQVLPYPATKLPSQGLEVEGLFQVTFEPGSDWQVDRPSPGQSALQLFPLVSGSEEAVPQALPRLAKMCQASQLFAHGQRGEAEQVLTVFKEVG